MTPMADATHQCPLCSFHFVGADCHGSCPMAAGCAMIRCPRCAYEFVEDGFLARMVRRWLGQGQASERTPR